MLVLPKVTPGVRRALDILYRKPPMAASIFGTWMWPERRNRGASNGGGGDYAAQCMLGRMRKLGLTRTTCSAGSSLWELTTAGKALCRP